jgi:hypothetical protein
MALQVVLGLYIIRGDNMYVVAVTFPTSFPSLHSECPCRSVVGLIDDELDKKIDFSALKAEPLKQVVH